MRSLKALVVDDAALARVVLKRILAENGFEEIFEAENGEKAIQLYKEQRPNLVTMDITMPEMDGITCIRKLMEIDSNANIIVCSALGQKEVVIEAIQAGAKHFMIKPFDNDKIVKIVKAVMSLV